MLIKSSREYVRRRCAVTDNRNPRESGRIRYENKRPQATKENEPPGMEEYIIFKPNLRSDRNLEL